ncbi:unnamed protein product [Leuciscus chuanchicus]
MDRKGLRIAGSGNAKIINRSRHTSVPPEFRPLRAHLSSAYRSKPQRQRSMCVSHTHTQTHSLSSGRDLWTSGGKVNAKGSSDFTPETPTASTLSSATSHNDDIVTLIYGLEEVESRVEGGAGEVERERKRERTFSNYEL